MEQKLTTQDICKLIEVLAEDNDIRINENRHGDSDFSCSYYVGKLCLDFFLFYKEGKYHYSDCKCTWDYRYTIFESSDTEIIAIEFHKHNKSKQHEIQYKNAITEILNIIHNDKETKQDNN